MALAFQRAATIRSQLAPGSWIPPVIVPFHHLTIDLGTEDKHGLSRFSSAIASHNAQFKGFGLTYVQDVVSKAEETSLLDHTVQYMKLFGARVEESHLIQLSDCGLNPTLPAVLTWKRKIEQSLAVQCLAVEMKDDVSPNFNYFPSKTTLVQPHHDNLFLADQICVLTLGPASARRMEFCNPTTGHRFVIYIEPRSMYIMDGPVRYNYTHGSPILQAKEDDEITKCIRESAGQRFSYVLGVQSHLARAINDSPLQIWGEHDQRKAVCALQERFHKTLHPNKQYAPDEVCKYLDFISLLEIVKQDPKFCILEERIRHVKNQMETWYKTHPTP
jgi:hypothetical protein